MMRKSLQKLLCSVVFIFCLYPNQGYTQERDLSVVILPEKSTMLSETLVKKQRELDLKQIKALDDSTLERLYEELPNRTLDQQQSRTMTTETQKVCRGIARDYEVDIRHIGYSKVSYWDFDDGKPRKLVTFSEFDGKLSTSYSYETPGIYTIIIEFFNDSGQLILGETKSIKVIVEACAPPAEPQFGVNPNIHKVVR